VRQRQRARFVKVTALVIVVFVVLAIAAQAVFAADPPPVHGSWTVSFTPTRIRLVGQAIPRGNDDVQCASSCQASYQFAAEGLPKEPYKAFFDIDGSGCAGPPCEMPVGRNGAGFQGAVAWDGTTYTLRGRGQFHNDCPARVPEGTDSMRFTVSGSGADLRLTGDATLALSYVTNGSGAECRKAAGYEVYTGTITGTPNGLPRGLPAATALPAAGGGSGSDGASGGSSEARNPGHGRPGLAVGVADPRSLPWGPSRLAVSALLALLLVLLMPFPAALFNSTLEENYDEVRGWFSFVPRRDPSRPRPVWRDFALVVVLAAVLNAFLDPGLRFDRASGLLLAGLVLSIAAVSLLAVLPSRLLRGERAMVRVYPLGLAVAAVCVLVSRLTSFEPGYLYGVVAGFAFARPLRTDEQGRLSFVTAAFLLGVAAVAFVLRIPVHSAAADGATAWVLLDTVLAAVFAAGVEANVLGLLPLRFLAGERLMAWRRWAWAAAFGLSLFAFLHALSARAGDDSTTASVAVAAALFGVFATVSVTFWAYFRYRPSHPTRTSV
jgi:hypothetical protein